MLKYHWVSLFEILCKDEIHGHMWHIEPLPITSSSGRSLNAAATSVECVARVFKTLIRQNNSIAFV